MSENPVYSKYNIGIGSYGYPVVRSWEDGTKLIIGNYCSFADNVTILIGGEHHTDWITTYPFNTLYKKFDSTELDRKSKGNVSIGNDVWIGKDALILSGVSIGNGAVIGAGSVISKNVPNYAIMAGNPAKVIRYRFNETTIRKLEVIAWWDWPAEKIEKNIKLLMSNDVNAFIDQHLIV